MKRYEFICKGRKTHTIDAINEDNARAFFAENRHTAGFEIIDVIEKDLPSPIVFENGGSKSIEGFSQTITDSVPTKEELLAAYNAVPESNRF